MLVEARELIRLYAFRCVFHLCGHDQPVEIAGDSTTGATIDADDASDPVGQSTEDVPADDTEDES